jgi:O-antigen ligase
VRDLQSTVGLQLPGREFWLPVLALLIALAAGALLPMYGTWLTAGPLLGLMLAGAVFVWPMAGLLATVSLTSTIFAYGALPRVGSSGASLYLPEILLILLVLWTLRQPASGARLLGKPGAADLAIVGLLVASAVSVAASWLLRGESISANLTQARWMAFYALYFIARRLLAEPRAFRRLIYGLFGIGAITAVIFDLLVLTNFRDLVQAYSWFSIDAYDLYVSAALDAVQGARIYMPGRALVQLLFLPALVGLIVSPPGVFRRVSLGLTLLFGLTTILIFTRMVWLTTLVTVFVLALLLSHKHRGDLLKLGGGVIATVLAASLLLSFSNFWSETSPLEAIYQRFGTVFADNVQDQDAQYRIDEATATLTKASENWVLGSGFLATVRTVTVYDKNTGNPLLQEVGTGHNGYLSLLLNTGLLGLGFFLTLCWLIVRATWMARTHLPTQDWFTWAMTLGFGLSIVRILMNGVSESTFTDSFTVPLIAVAFALVERGLAGNAAPDTG